MMEGLDPNLLVNSLTRDNDNSGFGGNNGMLWIFLLLLFGWGGNGFGGKGTGDIEAALAKAQAAGASDATILTAIAGNKEAINSLGSYLGVEVNQVQASLRSLETGLCQLGYQSSQETASIISQITAGNAALSRQLADCCCQTQRAIDGVNYNMATQFAATNNAMTKGFCDLGYVIDKKIDAAQMENRAGFQSIREMYTTDKIATLQRELEVAQFHNSQQAQTAAIKETINAHFNCAPGFVYSKPACPTTAE